MADMGCLLFMVGGTGLSARQACVIALETFAYAGLFRLVV